MIIYQETTNHKAVADLYHLLRAPKVKQLNLMVQDALICHPMKVHIYRMLTVKIYGK